MLRVLVLTLALFAGSLATAADWPQWRGPTGDTHAAAGLLDLAAAGSAARSGSSVRSRIEYASAETMTTATTANRK